MASFYHAFVRPKAGVDKSQVEKQLDLAVDWFRYSANNYIIYTTSDAKKWMQRLSPFVKPGGRLFICRFDIEQRSGLMNKAFVEWVNKSRPRAR